MSTKKTNKHDESDLQQACVKWFDLQYPKYSQQLFAIPNGGKRDIVTATILNREGVRKGVFDILFAKKSNHTKAPHLSFPYSGMYIEFKTKIGKLTPEQKEFKEKVETEDYLCVIVRSFDEFMKVVKDYLNS